MRGSAGHTDGCSRGCPDILTHDYITRCTSKNLRGRGRGGGGGGGGGISLSARDISCNRLGRVWCVVCRCRAERPEPEPHSPGVAPCMPRARRAARPASGSRRAGARRRQRSERCAVGLCGARAVGYTFYAFAPAGVFILFMRPEDCDHPMPVAKSDAACCARDGNATSSCYVHRG